MLDAFFLVFPFRVKFTSYLMILCYYSMERLYKHLEHSGGNFDLGLMPTIEAIKNHGATIQQLHSTMRSHTNANPLSENHPLNRLRFPRYHLD